MDQLTVHLEARGNIAQCDLLEAIALISGDNIKSPKQEEIVNVTRYIYTRRYNYSCDIDEDRLDQLKGMQEYRNTFTITHVFNSRGEKLVLT